MSILRLPINSASWLSTLTRWGAEMRSKIFMTEEDLQWQDWGVEISSPGGVMTVSNVSISYARYTQVGKTIFFRVEASFTTSVAGFPFVTATLPFRELSLPAQATVGSAVVYDPGTTMGMAQVEEGLLYVSRYDSANWSLGASRRIRCSGFYEIV